MNLHFHLGSNFCPRKAHTCKEAGCVQVVRTQYEASESAWGLR